jgi:HAMP domain-containing protein
MFMLALVLLVITAVSMPLFNMMERTQRQTLMRGMWDRSAVLLASLTVSARTSMRSNSLAELAQLPNHAALVPEANYVTITGFGTGGTPSAGDADGAGVRDASVPAVIDYIWATSDADIRSKINTPSLVPGVSRLTDSLTPILPVLGRLEDEAKKAIGGMADTLAEYRQEGAELALAAEEGDDESRLRLESIQIAVHALESSINTILDKTSAEIYSYPFFNIYSPLPKAESYILYKPIMFQQGTDGVYLRGLVRLEVSTAAIVAEVEEGRRGILAIIFYVALAAMLAGIAGALLLSALIIRPIRRLARHVEKIRDTENKAELAGVEIRLNTKDELGSLADTINGMTRSLVKAALAAEDLSVGKAIQKKFIPLETDNNRNKLSYGARETPRARFFGYYEGAKGVSGDYFDYQAIDSRRFAIIKCDVAGKGVPAALIMAQVATMFRNYFKTWGTDDDAGIEPLVYLINDFIETLDFEGRFAAFTLCVFDTETGLVRFCNAGDCVIRLFDSAEGRLKSVRLPETPAAGFLPNSELEGAYQIQTLMLARGDMLLLYTDGIEESKRVFRGTDGTPAACAFGVLPDGVAHGEHRIGDRNEMFGGKRIADIIDAVMNRGRYTLRKPHDPQGDIEYRFDYSGCAGTVDEAVMAVVSAEKLFRMFKAPAKAEDCRVPVDARIDSFLRGSLARYDRFRKGACPDTRVCTCADTNVFTSPDAEGRPDADADNNAVYYEGMCEDEQYDDIAILGVLRKN